MVSLLREPLKEGGRPPLSPAYRLAAVLVLGLQATALLAGCVNSPAAPQAVDEEAARAALARALESRLGPGAEALQRLLGGKDVLDAASNRPKGLGDLLGRVLPAGLEQLPIPTPARENALANALAAYGAELAVPVPTGPELDLLIRPLRLDDEGQYALAQLILAYTQAFRLERQALEGLQGPDGEIDLDLHLQAADLLARTAERVRGPLGRPPAPLESAARHPDSWEILRGVVLRGMPGPALPPFPQDLNLAQALQNLAVAHGFTDLPIPAANLPATLDHAVALIVQAKADGVGHDGTWASLRMFQAVQEAQPALEAWAALLRIPAGPAVDARGALASAVTRHPYPAAIVAALHGRKSVEETAIPSLVDLLQEQGLSPAESATAKASLGPAADALALLLDAHAGLRTAREEVFGELTPQQATMVGLSLWILPLLGKATWNATEANLVRTWAEGMQGMDAVRLSRLAEAQERALAQVGRATKIMQGLSRPSDSPTAPTPVSTPTPLPPLPPLPVSTPTTTVTSAIPVPTIPWGTCVPTNANDCQNNVLLMLRGNTSVLVTGFGSSRIDGRYGGAPDILLDLGGDDVYTVPMGVGIGGTQPITGTLNYTGVPDGDTFTTLTNGQAIANQGVAWFASVMGNSFSLASAGTGIQLAIDAGGSDTYASKALAGEGVGIGMGALGVLLDLQGDDRYLHTGGGVSQGFGAFGGVGVLADLGGSDHYNADGVAQGVSDLRAAVATDAGICPYHRWIQDGEDVNQIVHSIQCPWFNTVWNLAGLPGGVGLLVDSGPGRDGYSAFAGQGFSFGAGAGLLVDAEGDGTYETLAISGGFQGGRSGPADPYLVRLAYSRELPVVGDPDINETLAEFDFGVVGLAFRGQSGLGALVDLGGKDNYSNVEIPRNQVVFSQSGQPKERHDNAVWIDPDNALGIGIDSSLEDMDGNGRPELVDVLGGSLGNGAVQVLLDLVDRLSQPPDAQDPLAAFQDVLFDDLLLCNMLLNGVQQVGACSAANRADLYTCNPDLRYSCLSLLRLTGVNRTVHDHPALVDIDLGGDDVYNTTVAGTYVVPRDLGTERGNQSAPNKVAVTGFALELGGNDRYATPHLSGTLASGGTFTGQAEDRTSAALLLDLGGDDLYQSAGAATGGGQGVSFNNTVAILADFNGTDTYQAGDYSQGTVVCPGFTSGSCPGAVGALVDFAGDDTYFFHRQGTARTAPNDVVAGTGVFLDGAGRDRYFSSLPVNDVGLSRANPNDAFLSQGAADWDPSLASAVPFFGGTASQGFGVFLDASNQTEPDQYWAPKASNITRLKDLNFLKENAVLRGDSNWIGNGSGASRFADNPEGAFQDLDEDGVPGWLEILAGTNPNDGDDFPGSMAKCAGLADRPIDQEDPTACLGEGMVGCESDGAVASSQAVADPDSPLRCVGEEGPVFNAMVPLQAIVGPSPIQLAQGLFVGGHGSTTYDGFMPPFFVDLGGNDNYTASNTGGAATLWDLSTTLFPVSPEQTPQRVVTNTHVNPAVTLLLDAAGDDDYLPAAAPCGPAANFVTMPGTGAGECGPKAACGATIAIQGTASPQNPYGPCPTLGAALGGISVLADNGGANRFVSRLAVTGTVDKFDVNGNPANPRLILRGLSQGAGAAGGVGILATWNATNSFLSTVEAALTRPGQARNGAPNIAVAGNAQGAGIANGIGILATFGEGADTYESRTRAQVTSLNGVVEAAATIGCSQGAACGNASLQPKDGNGGIGILYDEGGANRFLANGSSSQGAVLAIASGLGLGVLWSGAGGDQYRAGPFSQAATKGSSSYAAVALVDAAGSDTYTISPPEAGTCSGAQGSATNNNAALLLDLAGDDRFDAGPCTAAQGSGSGYLVDLQGTNYFTNPGANKQEIGSWSGTLGGSLGSTNQAGATVVLTGTDQAGHIDRVSGVLTLQAKVTVNDPSTTKVDRVAFRLPNTPGGKNVLLGDGSPSADPSVFTFTFNTTTFTDGALDYPDGDYKAQALAFLGPVDSKGRVDFYIVFSNLQPFIVDNPPVFVSSPALALSNPNLPGISPARGQYAAITFGVTPDVGGSAGADYAVVGTDEHGDPWRMLTGTAPAGDSTVYLAPPPAVAELPTATQKPYVCQLNPSGGSTTSPNGFQDDGYYLIFRNSASAPTSVTLGVNDLRLVPSTLLTTRPAGTLIADTDTDKGTSFTSDNTKCWSPVFRIVDANSNGMYDAGDWVISDSRTNLIHTNVDSDGFSAGDIRLTPTSGFAAGTLVLSGASDLVGRSFAAGTDFPTLALRFHDRDLSGTFNGLQDRLYVSRAASGTPAGIHDVRLSGDTGSFGSRVRPGDQDFVILSGAVPQCAPWNPQTLAVSDAAAPCADGLYRLELLLWDGARKGTLDVVRALIPPAPPRAHPDGLLIDTVGSVSRIDLGPYAGNGPNRVGTDVYFVPVAQSDATPDIATAGSGSILVLKVERHEQTGAQGQPLIVYDSPQVVDGQRLSGVGHMQTVHLMSVARDKQGNQESPCQGAGDILSGSNEDYCYKDKLGRAGTDPSIVRAVTFDFKAPTTSNAGLSPLYAKLGDNVKLNATITDDGLGVLSQSAGLGDGLVLPLNATGGATWDTSASTVRDAWAGREGPYTVTFAATDKANNKAEPVRLTGYLDDLAPRVEVTRIVYTDLLGANPMPMGKPGRMAQVTVRLQDIPGIGFASIANLSADASPLGGNSATGCQRGELGIWTCEILLPEGSNGDYPIRLNATDKAGNANTTVTALLQVHGEPLAVVELAQVVAKDHSSFTVRWRTDRPADTMLHYGTTRGSPHSIHNSTLALNHTVTVTGLEPFTRYYFQGVSTTLSGVQARTPIELPVDPQVVTDHGFGLSLKDFAGVPRAGSFGVTVEASDLVGRGAVGVSLKLQEELGPNVASTPQERDAATLLGVAPKAFGGNPQLCFIDANGNGTLDVTETLLLQVACGPVAPGSLRLAVNGTRGGSLVAAHHSEAKNSSAAAFPNVRLAFGDGNGNGVYDAGERLVISLDGSNALRVGDILLAGDALPANRSFTRLRPNDGGVGGALLPAPARLSDVGWVDADHSKSFGSGDRLYLHPGSTGRQANLQLKVDTLRLTAFGAHAAGSRIVFGDEDEGRDQRTLQVDTRGIPDGRYRLVVEGVRGVDERRYSVNLTNNHSLLSMPFRIDNTPPVLSPVSPLEGGLVSSARPELLLNALDPAGDALPGLETLYMEIDGNPMTANVTSTVSPDNPNQLRLALRPETRLGDGRHVAALYLRDAAGNLGQVRWNFTIDTHSPRLVESQVLFGEGRTAAQPGGNVTLRLNLTDPRGVSSVFVDLSPHGGNKDLPMRYVARDRLWEATVPIPSGIPDGTAAIRIMAVDALGNGGRAGQVEVPVDGTPPTPRLEATGIGQTGLTLKVRLDEAANVTVHAAGSLLAAGKGSATSHDLGLSGLRPGREHALALRAIDGAGNVAEATFLARTLDDTQPPTRVPFLQSASEEEGVVELQWTAATDDSGVQNYTVSRSGNHVPSLHVTLPANATSYRDADAPPGRTVTYTIHAVDVADLPGPEASVAQVALALPHLSGAGITPDRGTTDTRFTIHVTYRHPMGQPADGVSLLVGTTPYTLHRANASDCATGCRYESTLQLPATSLKAPAAFTLRAGVEGHTAELPLEKAPTVRLGNADNDLGVVEGTQAAPMPVLALEALALLGLAGLARRRHWR